MEPEKFFSLNAHDFLSVEHENVGFLINRDQFFASVYLDNIVPYQGNEICPEYCAGTMMFRHEKLVVYELDTLLGELFQAEPQEGLKIALVSDVSMFNKITGNKIRTVIANTDPEASTDYLAFRIGSQSEIIKVDFSEIKLLPGRLRKRLNDKGILGCRFRGNLGAYFFIDIDTVIFGGLTA